MRMAVKIRQYHAAFTYSTSLRRSERTCADWLPLSSATLDWLIHHLSRILGKLSHHSGAIYYYRLLEDYQIYGQTPSRTKNMVNSHSRTRRNMFAVFSVVVLIGSSQTSEAFSMTPKDDNGSSRLSQLSRRQLLNWLIGIGGVVIYGKLLADAAEKISRGDSVYPEAHERRVESII